MLRVAPQADVGREASRDASDVERLAEVGQHSSKGHVFELQSDVEFRRGDVVGHARRQRTSLGEVEHGAHVGLFAAEIDARNLQVDVVQSPRGVEFEVLVEEASPADADVVKPDFPRFGRFFGHGRGVRRHETAEDVVETERIALLVNLHVGSGEVQVLHLDAVREQRQQAQAHVETVEREEDRRVVRAADPQPFDAQASREYIDPQALHADRAAQQFAVVFLDVVLRHGRNGHGEGQYQYDQYGRDDQRDFIGFLHSG